MHQMPDIANLRRAAQQLRTFAPDKAAEIDHALAEVEAGKRDLATINVGVSYRLEKFDGDYRPGVTPLETITGKG
jgi:phage-related protein